MTDRTRESLKRYFREGALPTADHFADLIDSMLNMSDEGFRKSVEQGFEVYAPQGHDVLLSFFRDKTPETPAWQIGLGGDSDQLLFAGQRPPELDTARPAGADEPPPVLSLDQAGRVGIGTRTPQFELDVAGTLRSSGRRGMDPPELREKLLADGQWHDVTGNLHGCQAFEIMAGAGYQRQGRFGLLHAVAINTYNPTLGLLNFFNRRRGIRVTHGYYSRRCDRLQLRWTGTSGRNANYRLQVRTGCDFGPDVLILLHLTRLWFDPHMEQGQPVSHEPSAQR
jgi:hypothetical protein